MGDVAGNPASFNHVFLKADVALRARRHRTTEQPAGCAASGLGHSTGNLSGDRDFGFGPSVLVAVRSGADSTMLPNPCVLNSGKGYEKLDFLWNLTLQFLLRGKISLPRGAEC